MDILPQIIEHIFNSRKVDNLYKLQFDKFVELDNNFREILDKDLLLLHEKCCWAHDEVHSLEISQAICFAVNMCRNIFLQQDVAINDSFCFDF